MKLMSMSMLMASRFSLFNSKHHDWVLQVSATVGTFLYHLHSILIVVSIKGGTSRNRATFDSVVRWDVAEKVERSGDSEWMI